MMAGLMQVVAFRFMYLGYCTTKAEGNISLDHTYVEPMDESAKAITSDEWYTSFRHTILKIAKDLFPFWLRIGRTMQRSLSGLDLATSGPRFNRRLDDPLKHPSKCPSRERPCTNFFPSTHDGKSKRSFWIEKCLRGNFRSKRDSFLQY